ncbi:MAG: glycogen/starch/alpha-glucan phosphorylase, partial [bacterium]
MSSNMQFDVLALNMEHQLLSLAEERLGKKLEECSDPELYSLVLMLCKRLLWVSEKNTGEKKVYYISAEFLVGRLLGNNLINMGLYDMLGDILHKYGRDLASLEELEREPSLGNGGLGRLAACFMDSIATLGLPGEGVGLNYHFGLFRQRFERRMQVEETDPWIQGLSWEAPSSKYFDVKFGKGSVRARLYNMEIVGYQGGTNRLRLFDLDTVDESLVRTGISFDKTDYSRNLTLFVYPDDSDENGIRLRVYQQYFLASCAAQLILQEMKERQYDL